MGGVALVWLLQLGAIVFFAFSGTDATGLSARFRRALTNRTVIIIAAGLVGFILTGWFAARRYDLGGASAASISFGLQFLALIVTFLGLLFGKLTGRSGPDFVFGSARFAALPEARTAELIGETGIRLGHWRHLDEKEKDRNLWSELSIHYTGERHLLTIAPTRAGKGVSTIIPNLLTYPGSAIVIDPKGENARVSLARRATLGHALALDPWGVTGGETVGFNPLDILTPGSPTLIEARF